MSRPRKPRLKPRERVDGNSPFQFDRRGSTGRSTYSLSDYDGDSHHDPDREGTEWDDLQSVIDPGDPVEALKPLHKIFY